MIQDSGSANFLQLSVLGTLQVKLGDLSLGDQLGQKARALLCYLAIEQREHTRTALATLLWGEFPEADAATNLRQVLSQLRRVLDPYLVITRHTIAFNPANPYWLDSELFERCIATARQQAAVDPLDAAVELYHGDFLQGFVLRDAPAFDDWVVLQRERLHAQAETALQRLAENSYVSGDYVASMAYTTRLLTLNPWLEEAHRLLMWLNVRTGQRSAALAQYQTCRRTLDQELGVEPMAETTALYERIKAAQATSSLPIALPATPFVGRAAEQGELARALAAPERRLVTIVGPGGIGKTRLALQVAFEAMGRFLHGARVVNLAALTTAEASIATLVAELGCGSRSSHDPQAQLRSYLADKDLLLVLDNFEQLVDQATDILVDILRHAPEVKVLVTSRERLQLRDEWLVPLAGLDVPAQPTFVVETYSAIALFVHSARKLRTDFALTDVDKPAVVQICRLVDGSPLGIELAASWTRLLSCAEIAQEIERSLEFLTTAVRDLPARHRSLRAVFDHSWQLLTTEEQRVLRWLTVFRGGFSRDAAEQVVGATTTLLGALLDKSLLFIQPGSTASSRYDLHDVVRHYARQKLDAGGESATVQLQHLAFFLHLAETAQSELVGAEQKHWLELLAREHDNVRVALQVALDHIQADQGLRLATALWRFWWLRGYLAEGCGWLQAMLALAKEATDREGTGVQATNISAPQPSAASALRALALHGLGVLTQEQGDLPQAQTFHEQSLALRRAQGDQRGIAFSLNSLGVVAADQGEYARAQVLYAESLTLKRQFSDQRGISGTLNNLGIVASAQGKYAQAQAFYTESLQLCRLLADADGIAVALGNLALVAIDQHDVGSAEPLLQESLALFQALGNKDGIVECVEGLAGVAMLRGEVERAVRLFGYAAAMRTTIGTPWTPVEQGRYESMLAQTHSQLDTVLWSAEWAAGQAMGLNELEPAALT